MNTNDALKLTIKITNQLKAISILKLRNDDDETILVIDFWAMRHTIRDILKEHKS